MFNRLWWVDPGNLLMLVILPVFVIATIIGGPHMPEFGTYDFLTPGMIILGIVCVTVMAAGSKVGNALTFRGGQHLHFDRRSYDLLLVSFMVLALVAYALLLGRLIADLDTILSVLKGERGAIFEAKAKMGWLVGITSFTNISPVVMCMASVRFIIWGKFFPSRGTLIAAAFLPFFILVHAFIGSERLVLIESGAAFLLPLFSFSARLKAIGRYAPVFGAVAVIATFTAGEFMRSWAYYATKYNSFTEFAAMRLLGYIAVAANTGAGMVTTMPPVGYPLVTARWFTRLPFLERSRVTYQEQYFTSFGNFEFNNPGGITAPIVDFGVPLGLCYLFLFGILLGLIYRLYRTSHPIGLLAYPILFVGLLDLTQIWFWGEPRFVPRLIFLAIAILFAVRRQVVRNA
jgi:hypothetical protein